MPLNTGRANNNLEDDDYVAQVLANEARDSSLKYSALGMGAYMPKRPTGAAPKPNTRFLRHIIKETDSHNAALKRKEEREARKRMRQLRSQPAPSSHDSRSDHHSRQHRSDDRESHRDRREEKHVSSRRRHRSRSASADRDRSHRHRRGRVSNGEDEDRHRSSRRSRRHRTYSQSRSRSPQEGRETKSRSRHHRHRRRSRSPLRPRSRSPETQDQRRHRDCERAHSHKSHEHVPSGRSSTTRHKASSPLPPTNAPDQPEYDSDPLEDIVGPLPPQVGGANSAAPVRSRGRGAYKPNMSNIDAHFAADYDPSLDVQPEEDDVDAGSKPSRRPVAGLMTGDDDWELALEAVRDRARWKQRGEDRLREAGFDDAFVKQWKSNTTTTAGDSEGLAEEVKWSKEGEGREWDRGKYINEEGHIDVKASW
ncbi:uncharacterized protein BDW43DRAFT_266405 [Aspergillus alliaceus]|uniref:uncharacterized protein n=1 Tax=Petromyces alliaceus TaxID=209559 RepID=UPI0012A7214D|nr:uncharacterized protein BDW43DRAFT_266405 [Aspergillus alliaceus]KAB8236891.1 hypothetical protein BDW43DRAFT_266405 [Aspergillus alliaceus]